MNGKTLTTEVEVEFVGINGKVLFTNRGPNEVLISGALDIAADMTGLDIPISTARLTSDLNFPTADMSEARQIFGLGISVDGSFTSETVLEVSKKSKGYNLTYLVPFKIVALEADDPAEYMQLYALRKVVGSEVYYYLKKFEFSNLYARTTSGLDLSDYPDAQNITEDVEAVIEYKVTLEKEECREYFIRNDGSVDSRRINAITLFRGRRHDITIDGETYDEYTDVLGANRRNFTTIDMGPDTSLNITYRLTVK
jgi:hypothetical protein